MKRFITTALLLTLSINLPAQTKRPINHRDYDAWRSISAQVLSRDGKFFAYGLFPMEGDGEVIVRNLATNQEWKAAAGERPLPTPPDPTAGEDAPPAQRSVSIAFTADGESVVFSTFATRAAVEQAKKDKKDAPHGGLAIMKLADGSVASIANVKSYQVPSTGKGFIAYLKEAAPGADATPKADTGSNTDDADVTEDQGRGGRAGAGRGGAGGRTVYGTDLVLRKLSDSSERTFPDVTEYTLVRTAETLAFAVSSHKTESNGVFYVTPQDAVAGEPIPMLDGKGKYSKLTWDATQKKLAFVSDQRDPGARPAKWNVYMWDCKCGGATIIASSATPGLKPGFALTDRGQMRFTRDASHLYVPIAAPGEPVSDAPATPVAAVADEDKVNMDLWSWKDEHIQPMQKLRATQERNRTYMASLKIGDKKLVQLSMPELGVVTPNDQGTFAFGSDDRKYRAMDDYEPGWTDLYFVDASTGDSKLLTAKNHGVPTWSADGHYGLYFDGKDWNSISVPDLKRTNLTAKVESKFFNEDEDRPQTPGPYNQAQFTRDGKWALLADRHDIWAVAPDGSVAKNLTSGLGRKETLRFRAISFPAEDEVEGEAERGIDTTQPLLLRAENVNTHDTGFYRLKFDGSAPEKLTMAPRAFGTAGGSGRGGAGAGGGGGALLKARNAPVFVLTSGTFNEFPDYYVTDAAFKSMKKVTDANPQKSQMLWGTAELVQFKNTDGVPLAATLFKPENFDPKKQYPLMVYIYEKLSNNVNTFVNPAPGTSINIAYYVSNGYLVLTPDIVYTTGYPGPSAMKCVLPAVQAVVDKGFVDEKAIGIQGHSWGGYQIAYMVTQTSRFRAAEAGAAVSNMFSAYNGIRWGSGHPRQMQYEHEQSRIGGSPWEFPERYIQNSPVFQADRIHTPLLLINNDADDAVPFQQGIEFYLALRRLGREAYMFVYNNELHGLRRRPDQKDYTVRMQQFFDHFLKGAPEPDWMKNGIPYIDRDQEKTRFKSSTTGDQQ